jgi:hypothetical protein
MDSEESESQVWRNIDIRRPRRGFTLPRVIFLQLNSQAFGECYTTIVKMDVLRLFLMAAFSIQTVASLPQDWSIFHSYPDSFELASALPFVPPPYELTTYPDSFELASDPPLDLSLDLGEVLYPDEYGWDSWTDVDAVDPLAGELQWDDPYYDPYLDLFAAGCSGAIAKRNEEPPSSCPASSSDESSTESAEEAAEEPNCEPGKEPTCCDGSTAFRSRYGGLNVGLCGPCEYILLVVRLA